MITSDRVSAFDHVLGTIPFKGQILTEIAHFWFDKTKDIIPNHIISHPDPQVLITKRAKTLPVEVIVRQYITGSLWREYKEGINGQYGFMLPDDLVENQKFNLVGVENWGAGNFNKDGDLEKAMSSINEKNTKCTCYPGWRHWLTI